MNYMDFMRIKTKRCILMFPEFENIEISIEIIGEDESSTIESEVGLAVQG
jgi:hypothetical protein